MKQMPPDMKHIIPTNIKQEAQLMLTNQQDTFTDQSRSPNIVPIHTLGIVSSCAIVTLSLIRAVFKISDFKNAMTLKTGLGVHQGYWKCYQARAHMTSYWRSIVTVTLSRVVLDIQCRKMLWPWNRGQEVTQCLWKWYHSIDCVVSY